MASIPLTEATLKNLKPGTNKKTGKPEIQTFYWDAKIAGFGVLVGKNTKTFVARAYMPTPKGPTRRRVQLGHWPEMSLADARTEALAKISATRKGEDLNKEKRVSKSEGPTLREALLFHLGKMERGERKNGKICSPRSIATTKGSVEKNLADYLDEPLVSLTADILEARMNQIERETPRRSDSNPYNPPGRAEANRVLQNVSKIWRSWVKRHPTDLKVVNPTTQFTLRALKERETRIDDGDLPGWYAKINAEGVMSSIRRDIQMVSLFTGVRSDGVRNLRWDDVDFDEELLRIEHAKGDRPYELPLTKTVREILERRLEENAADKLFAPHGGDNGYVFPTFKRGTKIVTATVETKERRVVRDAKGFPMTDEEDEVIRESYVPGIQINRRTFNAVARDAGVPQEARETLMNHEGRGVNRKHYSPTQQSWDYLRSQAELVEAALWIRIKGQLPKKTKGRHLKAVV